MCGSNTATQSVPRSPSPASAETLSVAHGSADHNHPPATPTAPAHTSAAPRWPTPPSPCSANNPSAAQSPRSRSPPTCAAVGSQPSPPQSAPASSLARLRPGSRGSWSIFSCRTVVSIQLPSQISSTPQPSRWRNTRRHVVYGACPAELLHRSARVSCRGSPLDRCWACARLGVQNRHRHAACASRAALVFSTPAPGAAQARDLIAVGGTCAGR